jgi:hypothetical protein
VIGIDDELALNGPDWLIGTNRRFSSPPESPSITDDRASQLQDVEDDTGVVDDHDEPAIDLLVLVARRERRQENNEAVVERRTTQPRRQRL